MRSRISFFLALFIAVAVSSLQAEESLTWQQCVSEARRAHPDLFSALALLQQAEADKRITEGSLLPKLGLVASSQQNGTTEQGQSSFFMMATKFRIRWQATKRQSRRRNIISVLFLPMSVLPFAQHLPSCFSRRILSVLLLRLPNDDRRMYG